MTTPPSISYKMVQLSDSQGNNTVLASAKCIFHEATPHMDFKIYEIEDGGYTVYFDHNGFKKILHYKGKDELLSAFDPETRLYRDINTSIYKR